MALGIEGGNLNSGFSAKFPYNSDTSWQLTLGSGRSLHRLGGRYIAHFSEWKDSSVYWYGGLSAWFFSGDRNHGSETSVGFGGGVGLDYDLRKMADFNAPVSVNLTIGPSYAFSDHYAAGLDLISVGFGVHYRFE